MAFCSSGEVLIVGRPRDGRSRTGVRPGPAPGTRSPDRFGKAEGLLGEFPRRMLKSAGGSIID